MGPIETLQSTLSFLQLLLQVHLCSLHTRTFLETFHLFLILANLFIVILLHLCLLFLQQFQLLAELQFRSTAIFHNFGNFGFERRHNLIAALLHQLHLLRRSLHLLDCLGKLRLQLHDVLGIDSTLGSHALDEIGILVNGILILHISLQSLQTFLHSLRLTLQTICFQTVQNSFFHLLQALFFQFLLQGSQLRFLLLALLFHARNRRVAASDGTFEGGTVIVGVISIFAAIKIVVGVVARQAFG
mmetsp:Transcript_19182/g.31840  ORF Transcript_19182/g.31840 Transcript_19182/m.31840 type:complete len:244 (-) Transcript_19182:264-995(-)